MRKNVIDPLIELEAKLDQVLFAEPEPEDKKGMSRKKKALIAGLAGGAIYGGSHVAANILHKKGKLPFKGMGRLF